MTLSNVPERPCHGDCLYRYMEDNWLPVWRLGAKPEPYIDYGPVYSTCDGLELFCTYVARRPSTHPDHHFVGMVRDIVGRATQNEAQTACREYGIKHREPFAYKSQK